MGSRRAECCNIPLTSVLLLCSFALASAQTSPAAFNITSILESFPNFSVFNQLLSTSGVATEINSRQSLTVLAVSDDVLNAFLSSNPNADAVKVADLLRYHVLLQFFSLDDLKALDPVNITSVTTLLQTTGKVNDFEGFVNIYNLPTGVLIGPAVPGSSSNSTVVTNIIAFGSDISIIQIASVLIPADFSTATGDLIKVLESRDIYTQFIALLKSTGVDSVFASRLTSGITVFAPTDQAFATVTAGTINSLSENDQKLLLEYHALTSYQNLDGLQSLPNSPVQTIASTFATAGYLLNVSSAGTRSKVFLRTGINNATVNETLSDAKPAVMYSIDAVLLPAELFPFVKAPSAPVSAPPPSNTQNSTTPASVDSPPGQIPAGNDASVTKSGSAAVVSAGVLFVSLIVMFM